MQRDEGQNATIDLGRCEVVARSAAQVEKRETKGWAQERGLQVHGDQDAETEEQVAALQPVAKVQTFDDQRKEWQKDQRDLSPIEHEAQEENCAYNHGQYGVGARTEREQSGLNQIIPADAFKHR